MAFSKSSVLLCGCIWDGATGVRSTNDEVRKFPDGFLFGTATASYQIEGAWKDGKSENIWDHMTHTQPDVIEDLSNGDVADDSYHLYKRDVEMMRELGIDFYRFSLSWTRILSSSFSDRVNEAGIAYYNDLIDELLRYNIEPMVTLYHWDLPQRLQDLGGWTNPLIVDWEVCYQGYGDTTKAPILNFKGIAEYLCAKNLLLAHAKAFRIYDEEYRGTSGGKIGIALSGSWYEPETDSPDDVEAAADSFEFEVGKYAHPIFSASGDFPAVMREKIAAKSAEQGFPRSRLPQFTQEEINYVRGTSDFFGLNHYSSVIVYRNESVKGIHPVPSFYDDVDLASYQREEWATAASSWLKVVPWGFYKLLGKIRDSYNNPQIFITENGFSTYGGLDDDDRVAYYRQYLSAMLDAIEEGADVRVYTAWSLMDNFEWMAGYTERFGLYEVDYESPERTRTPRKSAFVYKEIIRSRELDFSYEPNTSVMTIDEGH
ncbi:Myrosinase 1 [Eumeta japonica]|uniref:beta-glucosidase n=1 Tax=Eumeta variegata TaxID=151549 RepID=A0A4C1WWX4_EUMVA|nr:Myrosinase 1 [Eumeta japonica]